LLNKNIFYIFYAFGVVIFLLAGCGGGGIVNPPTDNVSYIEIVWPKEDGIQNVVEDGTILSIKLKIYGGASELKIFDEDGSILLNTVVQSGDNEVFLKDFGIKGAKNLVIEAGRVRRTLKIINDEKLLNDLAKEFAVKYCCDTMGNIKRLNSTVVYVVRNNLVNDLLDDVEKFWSLYGPWEFINVNSLDEIPSGAPRIQFYDETNEDAYCIAESEISYIDPPYVKGGGSIYLYKKFVEEEEYEKIRTLKHEFGHILVTDMHTDTQDIMDLGPPHCQEVWWPFEQKGLQLVYSVGPGEPIP
jgi:hypothetical protein